MDRKDKRRLREYLDGYEHGEADGRKAADLIRRLAEMAANTKDWNQAQKRIKQLEDLVASWESENAG